MTSRFAAIRDKDLPYLVMVSEGEIIGYAYASPFRPRIGYQYALEDSIYIRQGYEGKGIGKALLEQLITICTAQGYRQMIAAIGDIKNAGSIQVHRACGFILVGTLPSSGWKHGRWLDSIFMQRALGEGDKSKPV
jgi:phosphinothricin acetyltransferase